MFARYRRDRCYIIAEIGGNFTTFEEAKHLIDEAAKTGADAVKLQTYRAETLSSKKAIFDMENTGVTSQYELFRKYEVDEDLHRKVFTYAGEQGLDWFSTPSHSSDADMLERLGVGVFKVGSDDAYNIPFLKDLARRGKPVMMSTGMCTLDEVKESVAAMRETGNSQIMLLHAITSYPTHPDSVNLRAMTTLAETFPDLDVGYSDHTLNSLACVSAVAMGARIIEKHFTWDRKATGPDHMLSADPKEMTELVNSIRLVEQMRGDGVKRPAPGEIKTRRNNRKSIVLGRDVAAGEAITAAHLTIKRPGYGIEPKHFDSLVGRTARRALAAEDVLSWDDLT
ncbi:MAG TPA: N-acetylneuraminate synthase family protein [Rhizomicrobium sp.]|nr:N-acetylneuraminate synthase family protein [Rhizomicrobium sp.]